MLPAVPIRQDRCAAPGVLRPSSTSQSRFQAAVAVQLVWWIGINASIPAVFRAIQCIDITELERPDDLSGWRFLTTENPVEQRAVDALPSRPGRLAAHSFNLGAKQVNNVFVVEHAHFGPTDDAPRDAERRP